MAVNESTDTDGWTYAKLRATTHPILEYYLQGAEDQAWPCMPEAWQFKDSASHHDLRSLLMSRNDVFEDKTEYQVLKDSLQVAMKERLYKKAMATIFVIDRYSYWRHREETKELLDIVDAIVLAFPDAQVPPQVLVRKARVLKDDGALQSSDQLLAYIIGQGMHGNCHYKTRNQYLMVAANCLGIRGQIRYNLGIWHDAILYLVGSIDIANRLTSPDQKALSISLQMLTDILCTLSLSDYRELQESMEFQIDDPLLQAELFNKQSALLVKGDGYFYPMRLIKGADILLSHAARAPNRDQLLENVVERIKSALKLQTSSDSLKSRDSLHNLAVTFFSLHIALRLKGDSFTCILELSHSLYRAYCLLIWPLGQKEVDQLNDVMKWLGLLEVRRDRQFNECELPGEFHYPRMKDEDPMQWVETGATTFNTSQIVEIELQSMTLGEHSPAISLPDSADSGFADSRSSNCDSSFVDPRRTTMIRREPVSHVSKREPSLFHQDSRTNSSQKATVSDKTTYQSHLTDLIGTYDGFEAPQTLVEERDEILPEPDPDQRILNTNLTKNTTYEANLVKYHPIDNQWHYQRTLVFVEEELLLKKNKKGALRDVIKLHFLHQEENKGQYLGKRYRKQMKPKDYHDDVIIHQLSRYYVTLFNQKLQPWPELANQIQMVPVVHLELLNDENKIVEFLNVEPYIHGDFKKITNNTTFVNERLDTNLLLAFSHFTWCQSNGKLMVTDLQGWVPDDKRVAVILTDPAINSEEMASMGITNLSSEGLEMFWTTQHKECNHVCEKLGLVRNPQFS